MLNLRIQTYRLLPGVHVTVGHRVLFSGAGTILGTQVYFGRLTLGARPDFVAEANIAARIVTRINRREIN